MAWPHLLAQDGTNDNQRQGKLGTILHDNLKWMIRSFIAAGHKKALPVIEYKRENGWIKPHVAAMDENWQRILSLFKVPINKGIGGFSGPDDKNLRMFNQIGDIVHTIIDEDSHYDMIFLLQLKFIHENWHLFEESAEQAYQIANFHNTYRDILEYTKPLPLDDGKDDVQIDYVKMEEKLKQTKKGEDHDGME